MKKSKQPLNSRQRQAEGRRQQILDTVLAVFAKKGFAQATIKDIAAAAGMSSGLMYHYYSSKESLLEAAIEHHSFLPQMKEILKGTGDRPCRAVLGEIARRFVDLLEQKKEIVSIFFSESASNPSVRRVWASLASEGVTLMSEYLDRRIAAGELREHNTRTTARCLLFSLIMSYITTDVLPSTAKEKSEFIDGVVNIVLHGVARSRD
jgi:AcrR family transcriptional regulator